MAVTPLSQAIMQGMDPSVYRPLQQLQSGDALSEQGLDSSPTSKWGALGRLAQSLAGTYISGGAQSELAKTIAGGKAKAAAELMAALQPTAAVPSAAPQSAAPRPMAQAPVAQPQPAAQPAPPPEPGSANAAVADRFPAAWSPPSPNQQVADRFPAEWSPQAASGPADADAGPVAAIDKATQPRGIRNNNPLNIEDGPFAKSMPGYAGSDGRFAKFETQDHGLGAANTLLDTYEHKHGLNTVSGIINRWAPTSDGNNVSAYAEDVSKRLGIDPNAPVPKELRPALIAAMGRHENGVPVPGGDTKPVQVAQAAPVVASDAGGGSPTKSGSSLDVHKLLAVMQNPYADETSKAIAGKLLLKHLTPEEDEYASSPSGIFNKRTGELKQAPQDYGGLQGPELMTAVQQQNPALASQAKGVLEGRIPYPTGSRLNPDQQKLKELVTQIDPTFTAAKWMAMSNFEKNMASTVPNSFGGQVRSAGTVAKHLGDAHDALLDIEKGTLGASDTLPMLNGVKGFIRQQGGDQTYQNAIGHYDTAIKGLADEAENLLANGHGAEGSKLYWKDRLDLNKHSPTEVRGALDEFRSLMMGRVSNVAQEKDRVHGLEQGHTDPLSLFGPKEREIMKKISDETYKGPVSASGSPAGSAAASPAKVSTKEDYDKLQSGDTYLAPDGSTRTKK